MIRLLESGIREVGGLQKERLFVVIRDLVANGSPPTRLRASVLLRFLPTGEPFCCGEPSCHSRVFRDEGIAELCEYMRRKMNLRHTVSVELNVSAEYYEGISFRGLGIS